MAYLELCVTLAYSEPCHIQNPGIFRTQYIFRTLLRHILGYSERCLTLAYCVTPVIFRTMPYSEVWHIYDPPMHIQNPVYLGTFRHIRAYSIMIVIIALTFFFYFNRTYFSMKFKKACFLTTRRQFQGSTEST